MVQGSERGRGMSGARRVLMIGLDAAEPSLIEPWIADGTLPALGRLGVRGSYRRLASSAAWLAGSPWPTFYTGTSPAEHGLYHFLQWHARRQTMLRPAPDWLPVRPFWRALGDQGPRCLVVDAPSTYGPEPFHGVEIGGFATHDHLAPPGSHPAAAMREIARGIGPSPLREEVVGPQSVRTLLALADDLDRATRSVTEIALGAMRRESFDLCLVAFAGTHRAGHKLWDGSGAAGAVTPADHERLSGALRRVYRTCDDATGRLVEAAGEDTTVLVFSLHGMGANTSRAEILPAMLQATLDGRVPREPELRPALQRLRRVLPLELRYQLKHSLPRPWQDRVTTFWRTGPGGFAGRQAFCLHADLQGYIRLNLRGREAAGTVEPGREAERLLARIAEGVRSFCDADTGAPLVADVVRSEGVFPAGRRRDVLPDLVVQWADGPASRHRAIRSDGLGTIRWPTPGRNPDGRAGNHRGEGFLLAAGAGFHENADAGNADIRDLAPTVCALLGVPPPWPMEGRVLAPAARS
jgi:predicted AlkP superfamily phosphohydrolase/phosphomutase